MNLQLREITLGDLRTGRQLAKLADPHNIARMSDVKAAAFLANPITQDDGYVVQILAVQDGAVVGREDLLPGQLNIENQPVLTSWGSGMFVPDAMRGKGIGKALAQYREVVHETCVSCGVSNMLQPIYRKLGWIDFAMRRYILLRTTRPVTQRLLGENAAGRAASSLGDFFLSLHRGAVSTWIATCTRGLAAQRADTMPQDLDAILSAAITSETTCAPVRSVQWVNWLLAHYFGESHPLNDQWLMMIRDPAGTLLGYMLLKCRFHATASHRGFRNVLLGSLQDWMIFQPGSLTLRQIALLATKALAEANVDALEICLPPDEPGGFLRRLGFVPVGAQHFLFKGQPGSPLADERFHRPAQWRVRPGDGDVYFT